MGTNLNDFNGRPQTTNLGVGKANVFLLSSTCCSTRALIIADSGVTSAGLIVCKWQQRAAAPKNSEGVKLMVVTPGGRATTPALRDGWSVVEVMEISLDFDVQGMASPARDS